MTSPVPVKPNNHGGRREGVGRPRKPQTGTTALVPDATPSAEQLTGLDASLMAAVAMLTTEMPFLLRRWTHPIASDLLALTVEVKAFQFAPASHLRMMADEIEKLAGQQDALLKRIDRLNEEVARGAEETRRLRDELTGTKVELQRILCTVEVVQAAVPAKEIASAAQSALTQVLEKALASGVIQRRLPAVPRSPAPPRPRQVPNPASPALKLPASAA